MVPTNLAQVAAEAANAQRPLFDNGSVTLDVDVDDVFVKGDPARLRQIVTNLLSNALKFTPSGGAVALTVKASEQQAELTVDDTGPGIRPAECEHVFEPFWRGRDTGDVSGSGMGLAIVDGFVRAHGGDIHVVSQPGLGASFVVRLPRHA
jgi:two-component system sensor histidine kinase BaeS